MVYLYFDIWFPITIIFVIIIILIAIWGAKRRGMRIIRDTVSVGGFFFIKKKYIFLHGKKHKLSSY